MSNKLALVDKVISLILREAQDRRDDAGFSGSHSDGGASRLENEVAMWRMGRDGVFPPEWEKYVEKAEKLFRIEAARKDPGYKDYERIKSLIEGENAKG